MNLAAGFPVEYSGALASHVHVITIIYTIVIGLEATFTVKWTQGCIASLASIQLIFCVEGESICGFPARHCDAQTESLNRRIVQE